MSLGFVSKYVSESGKEPIRGTSRVRRMCSTDKPTLLASVTTAVSLASVGFAPAAADERLRLRMGGTMQQWMVVAGQRIGTGDGSDIDTSLVDEKHNSEIFFVGKTVLEHAITIGLRVELEANTDDQQISESFLFVEQPRAGRLEVGDTDNAAVAMHVGAPDGGISINDGDLLGIEAFVTPEGYEEGNTLIDSTALQLGDDTSGKFSYYTPRFAGWQLGISYIPQFEDGGSDNRSINRINSAGPVKDGVAVGLSFADEIGDFEIEAYAGYLFGDSPAVEGSSNIHGAGAGMVLSIEDLEIGGSFAWATGDTLEGFSVDGQAFDVGIAYELGPYRIGLTYIRGISEGSRADRANQHLDQVVLSGTYALAPGVDLVAGLFHYDADGEKDLVADSEGVKGNRGFGFASAIELRF